MYRRFTLAVLLIAGIAAPAVAADTPDFLKDKYASDPAACKAGDGAEESGALTLDKDGFSGTEFTCSFLDFWNELQDGKVVGHVALMSCGDDSGVTRPDFVTIVPEEDGTLRVQSQNEYLITESSAMVAPPEDNSEEGAGFEPFEFVTAIYSKCE